MRENPIHILADKRNEVRNIIARNRCPPSWAISIIAGPARAERINSATTFFSLELSEIINDLFPNNKIVFQNKKRLFAVSRRLY